MGVTTGPALKRPLIELAHGVDGAVSDDQQIIGTYVHGLFDQPQACDALLEWAGLVDAKTPDYRALCESNLDRLADNVEQHIDLACLGFNACPQTLNPSTPKATPPSPMLRAHTVQLLLD